MALDSRSKIVVDRKKAIQFCKIGYINSRAFCLFSWIFDSFTPVCITDCNFRTICVAVRNNICNLKTLRNRLLRRGCLIPTYNEPQAYFQCHKSIFGRFFTVNRQYLPNSPASTAFPRKVL